MGKQRKSYTAEFKQEAVRLVTEKGLSLAQASRDLDLNENVLGRWKKQLEAKGTKAFPGRGHPHDEEMFRLRRENSVLREERDILKKAISIFSQQKP